MKTIQVSILQLQRLLKQLPSPHFYDKNPHIELYLFDEKTRERFAHCSPPLDPNRDTIEIYKIEFNYINGEWIINWPVGK